MKKRITSLLLALTLALSLAGTALADENSKGTTVTGVDGATATFVSGSDDKIQVTFTSSSLQNGEQYIILMVSGKTDANNPTVPEISQSSIRYIDQQEVTADNGAITFTVYPDRLQTSVVLISSASGQKIAAIVNARYVIGDADGSGNVDISDVILTLQYIVQSSDAVSIIDVEAANADGEGIIDISDVILMLQIIVGAIQM